MSISNEPPTDLYKVVLINEEERFLSDEQHPPPTLPCIFLLNYGEIVVTQISLMAVEGIVNVVSFIKWSLQLFIK